MLISVPRTITGGKAWEGQYNSYERPVSRAIPEWSLTVDRYLCMQSCFEGVCMHFWTSSL